MIRQSHRIMSAAALLMICLFLIHHGSVTGQQYSSKPIIDIGSRIELFVDNYLIEKMNGAELKLHSPQEKEISLRFDKPWEGRFVGYPTVIKDGEIYKMYYRGYPVVGSAKSQVTCYAESYDGVQWTKPNLGIIEIFETRDNNIILQDPVFSHNFSPFIDKKPGIEKNKRFKALAGSRKSGLHAFVSADGINWRKMQDKPVITKGAFDSQNLAFWSESELCYVSYFRVSYKGVRSINRATSKDFINWSEPVQMDFGDTPLEHLYTNQTHPYFRAPHIYIALPMRFMPGRKVLTDEQARKQNVFINEIRGNSYANDCAEVAFMTSRGGNKYDRTFMEGFIRPGLDPGNWASRAGMAALGVVSTGHAEMSIYKQHHYTQPTHNITRYTLRTDGFASLHACYNGGEMITKLLRFSGNKLLLNFSTGAAGGVKVIILDNNESEISGYTLEDADEIVGDSIDRIVTWKGIPDVGSLSGKPVKIKFVMKDADIYSLQFRN